jgi:uncharacterized protein RhaS with RHS repeats
MFSVLPRDMQEQEEHSMCHALEHGLPPQALAALGAQAEEHTTQILQDMRKQLQRQEEAKRRPVAIQHYHYDHLGTPLALTDRDGCVVWAVKLAPWGNVQQEYNPQGIHQAIRLP